MVPAVSAHFVYERGDRFDRRVLVNPVAEIENMPRCGAEAVENLARGLAHAIFRRE